MPAFAQRMSIGPRPDSTERTIDSTDSRCETSATIGYASISSASSSSSSLVRAAIATPAPADRNSRAMFAPMPRPPPVTSAICPSSSGKGLDLLQRFGILQRRQVPWILPDRLRADGASHDLRAARLRQRADPFDSLGLERLAERCRDGVCDARRIGLLARPYDA